MTDVEVNASAENTPDNADIVHFGRIPIDKAYAKTINSILQLSASGLSFIAFICVAAGRTDQCDKSYASTYSYYEFVTISTFLTVLISWLLYILTLKRRLLLKRIPWLIVEMAYCGAFIVLYVIANIVLACQSCGADSNKAGCAFGFLALFCLVGYGFLILRAFKLSRQNANAGTVQGQDTGTTQNVEQY